MGHSITHRPMPTPQAAAANIPEFLQSTHSRPPEDIS
jgi:hypothetical protein